MKFKKIIIASVAALALTGFITGCGDEKKAAAPAPKDSKAVTLKVGVSPVPHAEILGAVKDKLAKEGVNVEIIEFTDYVQPNLALNDKNLDANYFQHKPYLDEFARSRNLKLVSAGAIHLEPMSVFSKKIKDLKDLPDGARVAIPNDPTNGAARSSCSSLRGSSSSVTVHPSPLHRRTSQKTKRIFNSLNWRRHSSPARWKTLIFPLSISILPWKQN